MSFWDILDFLLAIITSAFHSGILVYVMSSTFLAYTITVMLLTGALVLIGVFKYNPGDR